MNASAHPPAAPFLWGSLETFPLDHVFGVLALSRQLVGVRLADAEREVGAITVKAGHVLGAEDFRSLASGATALKTLVRDPGTAFSVTRLPEDQADIRNAVAIGTLTELFPETGNGPVQDAPGPVPAGGRPGAGATTDHQRQAPAAAARKPVDDSTLDADSKEYDSRPPGAVAAPAPEATTGKVRAVDAGAVPPVAKAAGDVILRGTLEEIRFEELLEVLEPNPDPMHISFMRGGSVVGTLDLMSKQVGRTAAGSLHGREAFARLYANPGEAFEVRRMEGAGPADALGSLSELLVEARDLGIEPVVKQGAPRSELSLFLEGRFADFSFELLIASLHLCRQPVELELRGDGGFLHRVRLKSGRIVSAESAGAGSGDPALAAIRENPGTEFIVYRRRQLDDGTILAPLQALISESGPAPAGGQRVARTADQPADLPARPVRRETGPEVDPLSGIAGRLDALAASITELRRALETERPAPGETPQVPQALSEFMSATANFVTVLEKAHKDALQQVCDTLRTRHRGLLRAVIALQLVCLAVIGGVAALVAL